MATPRVAGVEDLCLRGTYQAELRTPQSLRYAQAAFTEAIHQEAEYAPAWSGLAKTYLLAREYSTLPEVTAYKEAREAAERALTLDPQLAEAHAALGFVLFFNDWDASAAEREFQVALKIAPDLPLAHHWYGSMLTHEGRFQAALRELDKAQRLAPSSAPIVTVRALALGWANRRVEGFAVLDEALSLEQDGQFRNPATMHLVMGSLSLLQARDLPRFLRESATVAQLRGDPETAAEWQAAQATLKAQGEYAMWTSLLKQEKSHHPSTPTYARARFEAELKHPEQAIECLNNLYARHDPALVGIAVDPLLLPLHDDPRFRHLEASMGFSGDARI